MFELPFEWIGTIGPSTNHLAKIPMDLSPTYALGMQGGTYL